MLMRTTIGLFAVAVMIFAFQAWRSAQKDLGRFVRSDTTGYIAAIEYHKEGGSEAVILKPDGTVQRNGGFVPQGVERDLAWSPDGNFLYFVSDRVDQTFHVYRWAPSNNQVEPRTTGRRGRSNPSFPSQSVEGAGERVLMTSGGYVIELDPVDSKTRLVLPPPAQEMTTVDVDSGGGVQSQLAGVYGQFGQSFRVARWIKDDTWVAAVMRREEQELLLAQSLERDPQGKLAPPAVIAIGQRIEIDVIPSGGMVYAVMGWQWPVINDQQIEQIPPEFRKNNRITTPFANMVGLFIPKTGPVTEAELKQQATGQPANEGGIVVASDDPAVAFTTPRVSPDGTRLLLVVGKYEGDGNVAPQGLLSMPVEAAGGRAGTRILDGPVLEPSWSPDGNLIAFARNEPNGARSIFTVAKDGSSERRVSSSEGRFGLPVFSPRKSSP
jgi:TolB protein